MFTMTPPRSAMPGRTARQMWKVPRPLVPTHAVPVVVGAVGDGRDDLDAGVVDQQRERPRQVLRGGHETGRVGRVGDVGGDPVDVVGQVGRARAAAAGDDGRAVGTEAVDDRAADAAAASGDERDVRGHAPEVRGTGGRGQPTAPPSVAAPMAIPPGGPPASSMPVTPGRSVRRTTTEPLGQVSTRPSGVGSTRAPRTSPKSRCVAARSDDPRWVAPRRAGCAERGVGRRRPPLRLVGQLALGLRELDDAAVHGVGHDEGLLPHRVAVHLPHDGQPEVAHPAHRRAQVGHGEGQVVRALAVALEEAGQEARARGLEQLERRAATVVADPQLQVAELGQRLPHDRHRPELAAEPPRPGERVVHGVRRVVEVDLSARGHGPQPRGRPRACRRHDAGPHLVACHLSDRRDGVRGGVGGGRPDRPDTKEI